MKARKKGQVTATFAPNHLLSCRDLFLGNWSYSNSIVYMVRHLKKSPRPTLCFCLKPNTTPVWPSDPKEVSKGCVCFVTDGRLVFVFGLRVCLFNVAPRKFVSLFPLCFFPYCPPLLTPPSSFVSWPNFFFFFFLSHSDSLLLSCFHKFC